MTNYRKFFLISLEKSVGAVIFRYENGLRKFLLLHYLSGHWDFPKGHMEKGETEEMTLKREVAEETSLKNIDILPEFKQIIRYFYTAKGQERQKRLENGRNIHIWKKVVYYGAETSEKEIMISDEHTEYIWLPFEEAIRKTTFGNSKKVLLKLEKHLKRI